MKRQTMLSPKSNMRRVKDKIVKKGGALSGEVLKRVGRASRVVLVAALFRPINVFAEDSIGLNVTITSATLEGGKNFTISSERIIKLLLKGNLLIGCFAGPGGIPCVLSTAIYLLIHYLMKK